MKASELIALLASAIAEHGDREVYVSSGGPHVVDVSLSRHGIFVRGWRPDVTPSPDLRGSRP